MPGCIHVLNPEDLFAEVLGQGDAWHMYWEIPGRECQKYIPGACNIQNILWKHAPETPSPLEKSLA